MNQNLPSHYKDIADEMGISLYQRFSFNSASEFLDCSKDETQQLIQQGSIDHIQLTQDNIQFFGYQLLAYLLDNTTHKNTVPQNPLNNPERIIRAKEVEKMTGLSRVTIWRYEKDNKFPKRIPLGEVSVGWKLSEVQDWIQSR